MEKRFFTSESVTEGHPDKICDQIADAILDDIYAEDNSARVAIEVCATTGMVMVLGEVSTNHYSDIPAIVRDVIKDVGYDDSSLGFDYKTCAVLSSIDEQSPDIAQGVNSATDSESEEDEFERQGAGDQGMMFGYATDETEEFMPLPIVLAHALTQRLTEVRKQGEMTCLRPDGKAQVTVEYVDGVPERVDTIVVSTQHAEDVDMADLEKEIIEKVIKVAIPSEYFDEDTKIYVNPTGRFVVGGPVGDTGVTGRKIIVDTYGGMCRHGGGALSGKDPSKVDRSGLYMTRYICKNLVAAGVARRLEVQVAYAIGMSHPVAVYADSYGTGVVEDEKIVEIINQVFDLRPRAIIKKLGLDRPIYRASANYGHLGRNIFPWERLDKVEEIKDALSRI